MTVLRFLLLACVASLSVSYAHQGGNAYLTLHERDGMLHGELDLPLLDLDRVLVLDKNADGNISWGELRARHDDIRRSLDGGFAINSTASGTDEACKLQWLAPQVNRRNDLGYSHWAFSSDCDWGEPSNVDYRLFRGVDAYHRLHIIVHHGDESSHILHNPASAATAIPATASWANTTLEFIWQGIWHIWIGLDHILFLLALLVVAVYRHGQPIERPREIVINTVKIVTAFTIAHSITLALASFDVVRLSPRFIETGIALSVAIMALYTLWSMSASHRAMYAFLFGLLHGFGFANVLSDLAMSDSEFVIGLFAFNIGVELGQLAIVAVFLPLAILLRRTAFYRYGIVIAGSLAVAVLALWWAYQRYMGIG